MLAPVVGTLTTIEGATVSRVRFAPFAPAAADPGRATRARHEHRSIRPRERMSVPHRVTSASTGPRTLRIRRPHLRTSGRHLRRHTEMRGPQRIEGGLRVCGAWPDPPTGRPMP